MSDSPRPSMLAAVPRADRERIGLLPNAERLAAIRADQSHRWRKKEPLLAEVYFEAFPDQYEDAADALVIVGGEFTLRLESGEQPDVADFVRRFPRFAAELPLLFVTQQALLALPADSVPVYPVIPGYEILDELGQGAMGVVYRARQESLNRLVALKVLVRGTLAGSSAVARFRAEALACARLRHPNIVQVYDVGEAITPAGAKIPFLALELIDGPTLAEWSKSRIVSPLDAARIIAPLADAIHIAHQAGVVHRDVKPTNVLLAGRPRQVARDETNAAATKQYDAAADLLPAIPKIADFGLAKLLDGTTAQTASGDLIGTPAYMAPEQAGGKRETVGPSADIYALGAVLYELLTGLPPFRGDSVIEVIHQVVSADPVAPTKLRPGLARDLETVCLKCLEKEPSRRYMSSAALAEDLRRFMDGRPVMARPLSRVGVAWRWCRRYPAVAGLAAAVATLLVVIAIGSSVAAWRLGSALSATQLAERQTSEQLVDSLIAQADANRLSRRPGQRFETLKLLTEARRRADQIAQGEKWNHRFRYLAVAAICLPDLSVDVRWPGRLPSGSINVDVDEGCSVYARVDRSGACTVRRLSDDRELALIPGRGGPARVRISQDGSFLALAYQAESVLRLWSLTPGPPKLLHELSGALGATFRPDSRLVVVSRTDGRVSTIELPAGDRIFDIAAEGMTREVFAVPHPRDPVVALYSYFHHGVEVRELATNSNRVTLPLASGVDSVAWSRDGRLLVVICTDRDLILYETQTWTVVRKFNLESGLSPVFLESGNQLVGSDWNGNSVIWDAATGLRLFQARGLTSSPFSSRAGGIIAIAAAGHDLGLLRAAGGSECRLLTSEALPAGAKCDGLDVHPGGRLIAARSDLGFAFWDAATGKEIAPLADFSNGARVDFFSDGSILTSNSDGISRRRITVDPENSDRWRIDPPEPLTNTVIYQMSSSADGTLMACGSRSVSTMQPYAGISLWRHGGPPRLQRFEVGHDFRNGQLSPNGRWLVIGGGFRPLIAYDTSDGKPVRTLLDNTGINVRFSTDGRWMHSTGERSILWQTEGPPDDWKEIAELGPTISVGTFNPDGSLLALPLAQGVIRLVHVPSANELIRFDTPERLSCPVFTADGRRLMALSGPRSVAVWDLGRIGARLRESGLDRCDPPFPMIEPATELGLDRTLRVTQPRALWWQERLRMLTEIRTALTEGKPEGLRRIGRLSNRMGLHESAIVCFAEIKRQCPSDAEASYELGLAALDRKNWQTAESHFVVASNDHQFRDIAELLLAAAKQRQSRSDVAERDEQRVLSFCYEGFAFYDRGKLGPAIVCLDEAVRLDPKQVLALRLLSRIRVTAPAPWFDATRALEEARRAVALDPSRTFPRSTIGLALLRLGRFADARTALEDAVAAGEVMHRGFNWYYLTLASARDGDRSAAANYLKQAETWWEQNRADRGGMPRCMWHELVVARQEARAEMRAFTAISRPD